MKRTKSGKAWMKEHVTDAFVQRAKSEGYRSRAAYKLLEINERDHLLRPGMVVVDLGAAPGSWAQVAVQKTMPGGRVVGLDLLPVEPVPDFHFIQGDFHDEAVLRELETLLAGAPVDLVLSDMAPNISGIELMDQARSVALAELALDFAAQHLRPEGRFLVKLFQGSGFDEYRRAVGEVFANVQVRKPKASRDRSNEVYLLASRRR